MLTQFINLVWLSICFYCVFILSYVL